MTRTAFFPGNVAVSDLCVYTTETGDGVRGGTPHVHLVSTEAYVVTEGHGSLTTLGPRHADGSGGLTETPLAPGTVLWFTPGVIHRLVNHDDLRIVVIMSDSGLPEAGDAVMTFPGDVLGDPDAYAAAATLPGPGTPEAARTAAAGIRRDLAIEGFRQLTEAVSKDPDALDVFYRQAAALVASRTPRWLEIFEQAQDVLTRQTHAAITGIRTGDVEHLRHGTLAPAIASVGERGFGMCGRLRTFDVTPPAPATP